LIDAFCFLAFAIACQIGKSPKNQFGIISQILADLNSFSRKIVEADKLIEP
jgi:hypothetical protein